jgi:hypothetical protein
MDLHQNARLTFRSREALAKKIMIERLTLNAAAAAFNVSRKTAAKWWGRYRNLGLPGLRDRSSRPLHSPRRTSSELIAQVIALRRDLTGATPHEWRQVVLALEMPVEAPFFQAYLLHDRPDAAAVTAALAERIFSWFCALW